MPRYTVSREKFPVEQKFKGTKEHHSHIVEMAEYYHVSQQEMFRRCIEFTYFLFLFLVRRSVSRSDRATD